MKRALGGIAAAILLFVQPAAAQSLLRDAETEALLNDMSRPIAVAAGLDPRNFNVVLLQDKSINAFVAGGQTVYIHSGLIDAADDANEVQGVIAHEIGHIVGGHVPLAGRGMAPATGITVLSLLLGVAAMAAGAGEAGAGILAAGQQAAMSSYLAFSRTQESAADAAGTRFLRGADISGQGMLDFFKKLQNMEYRLAIPQDNSYQRTHPLSGERIANLTQDVQSAASFKNQTDPVLEVRFKRVQAKLRGYVSDPKDTLRRYPASDQSVYAHYARAYAYHKSGYPEQAADETLALVKSAPDDPYFLELEGQILLESGKPKEALSALREATEQTRSSPLIAASFGHALIATEDPALLNEAERVLKQAVARDNQNPFAWYQLSILYERRGDLARVALAMAEYTSLIGDNGMALASARRAMGLLPQGSSDWIRAQDIQMTSQTALEEDKRNRRRRG
ncbi:M48 family metalloprotease [Sphingomonas sp. Leaf10]|uniref:M48 family metalloprotease n=1 Tax=Sphingomonas sp. Leaf10 TaxID=1735676 RepID=UPI000700B575|nr:M48 family metalloprotease [Sphingomonas sp. Leaf10]KQM32614.1 peptidase M48 [Sphingomonas sp. Leaf10]